MPSGSRGGGGGGSHGGSRGGGSRSGSSRGGSHSGGGLRFVVHTRTRNSIRIRSRSGAPDRYFDLNALHSVICVILTICFMIFGSMACSASDNINFLEEDYRYYQNMIVTAEHDPDNYIVDAYVTSCSYRADFDKYYINYRIPYTERKYVPGYGFTDVEKNLYGYSFSVYTEEEAKNLVSQGIIKVAVDTRVVGENTDSIPLDYKYMSIEDDGEYFVAKAEKSKNTSVLIVLACVAVGWFVFFIIISKKTEKAYDRETAQMVEASKRQQTSTDNTPYSNHCEYCGTYLVKDNNIKCPACGATKTIRH